MGEVVLESVTKRFGDVLALDDVDLRVREGELLVLVGPSGCGKTTLLRVVAGLERPTEGTVSIGGRDVTDLPARKRDTAFVFQDYALFPHMDVRENLSFNLRMQGGYADVDSRVREAAELLDIEALLERDVSELSGGQKQRVALGRAVVSEPATFLLDEPLANLDAALRDRMQTEIVRLQRQLGTTTVHVTHDQREAMAMGDRIAVMRDGGLQQLGSPEAVYETPASLFVARFIGSPRMNTVNGRYDPDTGAVTLDGPDAPEWTVPADGFDGRRREVVVGSRPEDVDVVDGERPERSWLSATVSLVGFQGADKFVHLQSPDGVEVVARVGSDAGLAEGDVASLRFDPDHLHLFDPDTGERMPNGRRPAGGSGARGEVSSPGER